MRHYSYFGVLTAALATYLTMMFWSLPKLTDISGGLLMFDLRPAGYSFTDARAVLSALGNTGKAFYLGPQHWLDTAYPPLMALALAMSFIRLYRGRVAAALMGLSAMASIFDLFENRAVSIMLNAGPEGLTPEMASHASLWTLLKSGLVSAAMIALVIGVLLKIKKHQSGKASRQCSTSSKAS